MNAQNAAQKNPNDTARLAWFDLEGLTLKLLE